MGRQAKRAVVNEVWERGEIVMCIAVPDTCILAESNQVIKYCPLVTHRLRPYQMASFSLSCSINWLAIFGGSGLLNKNVFILQGLLHPQALDGVL